MVRRKEAKVTALLVVGLTMVVCFFDVPFDRVGMCRDGGFIPRLTYHFFHASLIHWFANASCLLSLFFIYDMSLRSLLTAYVVASFIPLGLFPDTSFIIPTVGMSGICFVLMGRMALFVRRKLHYQACIALYLALGFLSPNSNGWLHLYCYAAGLFVGFLNMPLR